MSIRSQFVTALQARLATIQTANGYQTDIGALVAVWNTPAVMASTKPCILIQDTKLTRDSKSILNQTINRLTCEVNGVLRGEDCDIDLARLMEEDILLCMGGWETADGLVAEVTVADSTLDVDIQGHAVGGVTVTLIAEYWTIGNQC